MLVEEKFPLFVSYSSFAVKVVSTCFTESKGPSKLREKYPSELNRIIDTTNTEIIFTLYIIKNLDFLEVFIS